MAKEERALFLALGHASNQVNALWKLVIVLINGDAKDPVKQRLQVAQTLVFVRLTIGAMWEAWRLVEDRFLKRPLDREFLPLLDGPAAEALERLKKRFGKATLLSELDAVGLKIQGDWYDKGVPAQTVKPWQSYLKTLQSNMSELPEADRAMGNSVLEKFTQQCGHLSSVVIQVPAMRVTSSESLSVYDYNIDKHPVAVRAKAIANQIRKAQDGMQERLLSQRVDGLILATVSQDDELVGFCIERGLPVILVNRSEARDRVSSVVSDDDMGMRLAVDHLVALGHRHMAHVAGPLSTSTGALRRDGFERAMARHGLSSTGGRQRRVRHRLRSRRPLGILPAPSGQDPDSQSRRQ